MYTKTEKKADRKQIEKEKRPCIPPHSTNELISVNSMRGPKASYMWRGLEILVVRTIQLKLFNPRHAEYFEQKYC